MQLGRYELRGEIASGGMATVHLGRQSGAAGFSRVVAIKRMRRQFVDNPDFVAMFVDEVRLAARIRHPNVVETLDVVENAGELFLVMEYVHGDSLASLIRAARDRGVTVPVEIAVGLVVATLHGLHAAHEATNEMGQLLEIVHRDVSPHNVLVGTDGVARVLDFGVAKAAGRVQTTREGQLKGKIAYMAPEQVRGAATRRSDVYAAAVVLWQTLTMKRLFDGDNEAVVLARVLDGRIDPPSMHTPGIPVALDAITLRGLSRDPEARFATARDMARALESAVPVPPPSVVAEWVDGLVGEHLARRLSRVDASPDHADSPAASMRAMVRTVPDQGPTSPLGAPPGAIGGAIGGADSGAISRAISGALSGDPAAREPLPELVSTQASAVALTSQVPVSLSIASAPRRRRSITLVACAVGASALLAWSAGMRHGARQATLGSAAGSSASSSASAPSDVALTAASAAPAPDPAPSASPAAVASVNLVPAERPQSPPQPSSRRELARDQAGGCNPPFTVDANGYRHYKRACLGR